MFKSRPGGNDRLIPAGSSGLFGLQPAQSIQRNG